MKHARAIVRLLLLLGYSGFAFVRVTIAVALAARMESARLGVRVSHFHRWSRMMARILGMSITMRGHPAPPPFVLVSNHLSYVDVILVGACVPGVFVAKSEIARWPILGSLTRAANTLFIERERMSDIPRVLELLDGVLDAGQGVILFPEGTSTAGDRVLPFRSPLLEVASRRTLPVTYATIRYETIEHESENRRDATAEGGGAVCWWGEMTLAGHLYRLLQLPGFHATLKIGARPIADSDRKALATKLRDAVASQLVHHSA
ncbi:MAG: 1-acyl-sn-glycerol-3-phosphate acyltransferase [Acidobacteriota bacterium]|nr:MAG: 1-acyl-sn-glycerol-3-phosphate acyltransferase [Acidobacteriota bacterium]